MQTTLTNPERESLFIDWLLKRNEFNQVLTVLNSLNLYRKLKQKYIINNFHVTL